MTSPQATSTAEGPSGESQSPFTVDLAHEGAHARMSLSGTLDLGAAARLWREVHAAERRARDAAVLDLDLSRVDSVDGAAMALLVHLRAELLGRNVRAEFSGGNERVQSLVHLYGGDMPVGRRKKRRPLSFLNQLGTATLDVLRDVQLVLGFLRAMVLASLSALRAPRTVNWKEIAPTMEKTGADAVPIVLLISFLVGLVMAFQASVQLTRFGAQILVADLIGISVTRELGPLMTAIVVCGRSGAAFAAELGSMKVNEEIDALRTMGLDPLRYLVMPRALALMLAMPLLALMADLFGILGGWFVGTLHLDLTSVQFFQETHKAVTSWDITSGLLKSVVFAAAVALIASQQGLAASGGAEGVGRRTTSAVVFTLFSLILIDAVFTVFFRATGL